MNLYIKNKIVVFTLLNVLVVSSSSIKAQNVPSSSSSNPISNVIVGGSTPIVLPSSYNQGNNPTRALFNYKRVFKPQYAISNESQVNESSSTSLVKQSTSYFDGFNRTVQEVKVCATGLTNHLIQSFDYRPSVHKYSYLPYSINSSTNPKFQHAPFSAQNTYYNQKYPNEPSSAISETEYYSDISTHEKKIIKYAPGKTNIGQRRGTETTIDLNGSSEVVEIGIDVLGPNSGLSKIGFFPASTLIKTKTINSDGAEVIEYHDLHQKLICKKILIGSNNYEKTYYVYDKLDRLKYTLSPKAVELLENNSWNFTTSIISDLCDYNIYDEYGRVIETHVAGKQSNIFCVYDREDRLVLTKDVVGAWYFSIYDVFDRKITKGKIASGNTRSTWQSILDNGSMSSYTTNDLEYYLLNNTTVGLYPTLLNNCEIYEITYYDNYQDAFFSPAGLQTVYDNSEFTNNTVSSAFSVSPPSSSSLNTNGLITGKKVKVIKPAGYPLTNIADWVSTVFFYDDNHRLIQTKSKNHHSAWEVESNQYDFKGRVLRKIVNHNNPDGVNKHTAKIVFDFRYKLKTFQLDKTKFKIDNGNWQDISLLDYNDIGQQSNKRIGGIESQDLTYNLRGQLTGINIDYVETTTSNANDITFGESIKYDYGFTNKLYHGNISGILWKGADKVLKSYGYTFDNASSLNEADYREYTLATFPGNPGITQVAWNNQTKDYSVSNITYDKNGNITTLKRYGLVNGTTSATTPGVIDDLTYTYENSGESNRLQSVDDAIALTNQYTDYDFKDVSGNDYTYDINGNLTADNNKSFTTVNNFYLNKPLEITFSNGDKIAYVYTGGGSKLLEIYTGNTNETYDYISSFVYKDNDFKRFDHSEGYALYDGTDFKHFFYVKDHLGNIRNVLEAYETGYQEQIDYRATFEIVNAPIEQGIFDLIDKVRDNKPASSLPTDIYSAHLDANDPNKTIGGSLLLKVMAGDQYLVEAEGYHLCHESGNTGTLTPEAMMNSIITSLSGEGGIETGDGNSLSFVQNFFNNANYINTYQTLKNNATDPNKPKSYFNYLFFDEDFNLIESESGVLQIVGGEGIWETVNNGTVASMIDIKHSGYLLTYVSNEDLSVHTYWDNIYVKHSKGRLVQEDHYYPYGLTVSSNRFSLNPDNQTLFQGKKLEKYNNLSTYDFNARSYDPQIGRFGSIDPLYKLAPTSSKYDFVSNNPISYIDPTGMLRAKYSTELQTSAMYQPARYVVQQAIGYIGALAGEEAFVAAASKVTGRSVAQIQEDLTPGYGPIIDFSDFGDGTYDFQASNGNIQVTNKVAERLGKEYQTYTKTNGSNAVEFAQHLYDFVSGIIHEYGHWIDKQANGGKSSGQFLQFSIDGDPKKRVPYSKSVNSQELDEGSQKVKTSITGERGNDLELFTTGKTGAINPETGETTYKKATVPTDPVRVNGVFNLEYGRTFIPNGYNVPVQPPSGMQMPNIITSFGLDLK